MLNINNSDRFAIPDILKGIAVIRMILVHIMEVFATQQIYESLTGKIFIFLAGPPGAPLFMIIMGYFISRSVKDFETSVRRGLKLIMWGFMLNIGLNAHLLMKIISGSFQTNPWPYVFGVDILFLAGFSLIILAFFKQLFGKKIIPYLLLALFFTIVPAFISSYDGVKIWPEYLLAFLWGDTWWSYFPIFPWAFYPVVGFVFHLLDKKYHLSDFTARGQVHVLITLLILLMLTVSWGFDKYSSASSYYHHSLLFALWIVILVTFWVVLINLVIRPLGESRIIKYLQWCGRHITNFYVFQWLLIGNIGTAIYKTQQLPGLIFWLVLILLLTSALVYSWRVLKRQFVHGC